MADDSILLPLADTTQGGHLDDVFCLPGWMYQSNESVRVENEVILVSRLVSNNSV